jgi:hypothetical protein
VQHAPTITHLLTAKIIDDLQQKQIKKAEPFRCQPCLFITIEVFY